jgi:signal transduction histidine kinase/ActR/RegA family two-component response regulator
VEQITAENRSGPLSEEIPRAALVLIECAAIDSSTRTRTVLSIFTNQPKLISLPVLDKVSRQPIGLISQSIFMSSLAKPFYKEIYLDRSCLSFMDKNPLVVEAGTPMQEVSIMIAAAGDKVVTDGFVITSDGLYLGIGFVPDVLRVMAEAHQKHSCRLAEHRDSLEALVLERTQSLVGARDAAEAAARAKSSFLANMSHEIRTPMNAIIGMTHLMMRDGLPAKQAERLQKVETAAQHLLGIINDILDLSKINAGCLTLHEEQIDLKEIVSNVASMLRQVAHQNGLSLLLETPDIPGAIYGDRTRLTQALLNYLSNAVKFTEHGSVTLRYRVIEQSHANVVLRFEVEDTGIGISKETLSELFSAFRQADDSTTRKYGGTGLGLAINRHIARLMGGEANADSTLGKGSVFWFTARLRKLHKAAPDDYTKGKSCIPIRRTAITPFEELRTRHHGARILVVEDEPINREIALEVIEYAGLNVDVAENGREAVSKVAAQTYDLVLMDMQMPELDGLAATREIRQHGYGRGVPIIAMTANAFAKDRALCLEAGMDDFLSKPFNPDDLYVCLLGWLDRQIQTGSLAPSLRAVS